MFPSTSGPYEGYLADVFTFMQAGVLREPDKSARFYRPFTALHKEPMK